MNMALLATQSAVDGQPLLDVQTADSQSVMIVASNAATNRFAIPAIAFTCCTRAESACSVNCVGIRARRNHQLY
jgi:hypothetical protein